MHTSLRVWIMMFLGLQAVWSQEGIDGIAAIVNKDIITLSEVRKQADPLEKQLRDLYQGESKLQGMQQTNQLIEKIKAARIDALNDLIDRKLILQEWEKRGLMIPETDIDDRIRSIGLSVFTKANPDMEKVLQANGYSMNDFREEVREQLSIETMRSKYLGEQTGSSFQTQELPAPKQLEANWLKSLRARSFVKVFF